VFLNAVEKHKETTPADQYRPPYLANILPYLEDDPDQMPHERTEDKTEPEPTEDHERKARMDRRAKAKMDHRAKMRRRRRVSSTMCFMMVGEPLSAQELISSKS
jgi:hypothetical protein